MIDRNKFSPTFEQNGDSCILASYAIGARYFTGKSVEEYFMAYCEHFGLTDNGDSAEARYNGHFHKYIGRMQINGYKMIRCLHDTSHIQAFLNARGMFDVEYLSDERCHDKQITNILREKEACLCASCHVINQQNQFKGVHSVVVARDSEGLYYIDTQRCHADIFLLPDWPPKGNVLMVFENHTFNTNGSDGLLLYKKQQP